MRVFLDTNVLVSAFTTRGLCADLMRTVLAQHDLITAEFVLSELRDVLEQRFRYSSQIVDDVVHELRRNHVEPLPETLPAIEVRDPDDLKVLASALAAHADVLVTGDKDLLSIAGVCDLPIRCPRDAWSMLRSG